ncbi:DUF1353 domain-containing protein [Roseovarius aestuarii]|nr:DUF1353 domain-containing protein [Roseovarius aestuarii]
MKKFLYTLPLILSGCAQLTPQTGGEPSKISRTELAATCERSANCRFINSPVQVDRSQARRIASRKVPFYPTLAQLDFVDGSGVNWVAPKGIVTDGASIPPIFVPIVGDPTSPEFVNAAAVHDAYCGIGNERGAKFQAAPWQKVHIMFYDALRVGGVSEIKAKVMFAAVWLGGPRWGGADFQPYEQPKLAMQAAMRRTKDYVETYNPAITELIEYLSDQERLILRKKKRGGVAGGAGNAGNAGITGSGGEDEGSNEGTESPGDGSEGTGDEGESSGEGPDDGSENDSPGASDADAPDNNGF